MAAKAASRPPDTGASRRFLTVSAWVIWLLVFAVAAVLLWRGCSRVPTAWGIRRIMWSISVALLLPYIPLRALAGWRCRRAARKLPDEWRAGASELPGWPGVRDRNGELKMRCGEGVLRLWVLAAGVAVSGYVIGRIPAPGAFDVTLSLSPALCALFFSALWGRSGWELSVESARSQVLLVLWRALRRNYYSTVSLPTVQGVALALADERGGGYRGVIIRRAKGNDWKLGVPSTWPPELVEALAARIANLAGVQFDAPGRDESKASAPAPAPAPPGESPVEEPAVPEDASEKKVAE